MSTSVSINTTRTEQAHLLHVHPLHWWCNMAEPTLQIMLHGHGIGSCEVSLTQAEGITLQRVERVKNPNYLFLYLRLANAQAQTFGITLTLPGQEKPLLTHPYTLYNRSGRKPSSINASDVVYLLMPDRFIDGDVSLDYVPAMKESSVNKQDPWARHGGDLKGMSMALDYLQELGVTAVWPTPIQENNMAKGSYHGYSITNFYETDPRLGTNAQFCKLVEACHERGLKVIMDIVFNHCGADNFLFADLPQKDWFNTRSKYVQTGYRTSAVNDVHASDYDRTLTEHGWFTRLMPDFDQRNPLVKDYLIQVSIWWVEYANIDGIRQDTYPYADRTMMRQWCERMEKEYPGFFIVGETWINNNVGVSYWQKNSPVSGQFNSMLPSVMDFPLMTIINQAVDEETDEWISGFARLYEYISQDCVYADVQHLLTFFDNHDTDRFHKCLKDANNFSRYKQALALLLTLRGIPQLYYGDEIGMYSNKTEGDGPNRQNFPVEALTAEGRTTQQQALFDYAKKLLNWRKQCPVVQHGTLVHFAVRSGCYVYARKLGNRVVTVILNGTRKTQNLVLAPYREVLPQKLAFDNISGKSIELSTRIKLAPRQILILEFGN